MKETCFRILFSVVLVGLWAWFVVATNPSIHRLSQGTADKLSASPASLSPKQLPPQQKHKLQPVVKVLPSAATGNKQPESKAKTGSLPDNPSTKIGNSIAPEKGEQKTDALTGAKRKQQPTLPPTIALAPSENTEKTRPSSKLPATADSQKPAKAGSIKRPIQGAKKEQTAPTIQTAIWRRLHHLSSAITAIVCCPERPLLAIGCQNGEILLWDNDKSEEIKKLIGHARRINALAFCQPGNYLLSGSDDGTLVSWDIEEGVEYQTLDCNSPVLAVAAANNGKQLLAGCRNNCAYLYRETFGREILLSHRAPVHSVAFWAKYAITCPLGGTQHQCHFKMWDITNAKTVYQYPFTGKFSLSTGGGSLLAWHQQQIRRFDCSGKKWQDFLTLPFSVQIVTFSSDSQLLAIAGVGSDVFCYHCQSKKLLAQLVMPTKPGSEPISLAFAGKNNRMLLASGTEIYTTLRQFSLSQFKE